jgi:hypothetical protein
MEKETLEFRATNLDCLLALLIAFGLPVACGLLYPVTGALVPLILYYGLCCTGVVKWRRGTLEYHRPKTWLGPGEWVLGFDESGAECFYGSDQSALARAAGKL